MDGHAWERSSPFAWFVDGLIGIAILSVTTGVLLGLATLVAVLLAWLAG